MANTSRDAVPVHKSSEHRTAVFVYFTIIITFVSLVTAAVLITMNAEKNRTGFQAIEVEQPISFIDQTYVKPGEEGRKPSAETTEEAAHPSH